MDFWNIFKKNRKGVLIILIIIEKKVLLIVIKLLFFGEGGIVLGIGGVGLVLGYIEWLLN